MMHQRQDPEAGTLGPHRLGQPAHRQPVDNYTGVVRDPSQRGRQARAGVRVSVRKGADEIMDVHLPAELAQTAHDPRIVDIPPGPLLERTGHHDMQVRTSHT